MRSFFTACACLLLIACASTRAIDPRLSDASIDFARAEIVEIKLSNFEFTPREISLAAGQPYVLKIVNTASGGHDFTAPDFFAAASVRPDDAALIADGQIELKGGEATTLHIVPAAGEYRLVCTHLGHATLGMTGKITVH